jgi:hypothetical protein
VDGEALKQGKRKIGAELFQSFAGKGESYIAPALRVQPRHGDQCRAVPYGVVEACMELQCQWQGQRAR